MTSPPAARLVLVGAVLLAGCSGFLGAGEPNRTDTLTPVDVPAGSPSSTPAGGRVDPFDLASHHGAVLANRAVTVTERRTERFANGTTRRQRTAVRYAGDGSRYYLNETLRGAVPVLSDSPEGRYELWANASVGVTVLRTDDGARYDLDPPGRRDVARFERLYLLLRTFDRAGLDRRRVDDGSAVVLRGTRPTAPDAPDRRGVRDLRNLSFVVRVDEDGLVRRYRLTYTGVVDDEPVTVAERVSFGDVGSTTVPRPDWVDAALRTRG